MSVLGSKHREAAVIGLVLVGVLASLIRVLPVDGSIEGFQIPGNPHVTLARTIGARFPAPPIAQVAVRPAGGTVGALLADLQSLENELIDAFPEAEITSLHTFAPAFRGAGVSDDRPVAELLAFARQAPLMRDLMSRDGTRFLLLVRAPFERRLDPDTIDEILAGAFPAVDEIEVFSFGHLERDAGAAIVSDVRRLTFLALLCSGLLLGLAFGSLRAVVFVLSITAASTLGALSVLSVMDATLNVATMLVLPTILIVSLADAAHLITGFSENQHQSPPAVRLRATLDRYFAPSLLTSVTTAGAFFSLTTAASPNLRTLGVAAGCSVLVAFVLTFLLGPHLLCRLRVDVRRVKPLERAVLDLSDRAQVRGRALLLLVPVALLLIPGLNFSTPPDHFFPSGAAMTITHDEMTSDFYALSTLEVLLRPDPRAELPDGASIAGMLSEISDAFEQLPGVYAAVSVGDLIQEGRDMGIPGAVLVGIALDNPYTARDGTAYRVEVRVDDAAIIPDLALRAPEILEPWSAWTAWDVTGITLGIEYVNAKAGMSLLYSFAVSTLFVLLLIVALTRSGRGTLAALAANAVPLSAAVILFGLARLELSVLSASVLVLCMGLIVDDTLHVLFRLVRRDGALDELPYGMAVTSIVVSGCFALFLMSSFSPVRILGGAISVVLIVALVADLTLVPSLFHLGRLRPDESASARLP